MMWDFQKMLQPSPSVFYENYLLIVLLPARNFLQRLHIEEYWKLQIRISGECRKLIKVVRKREGTSLKSHSNDLKSRSSGLKSKYKVVTIHTNSNATASCLNKFNATVSRLLDILKIIYLVSPHLHLSTPVEQSQVYKLCRNVKKLCECNGNTAYSALLIGATYTLLNYYLWVQ